MGDRIQIALIGCGSRGPAHAQAVRELVEFELVAVCDVEESRAKAAAEKFGVQAYTDLTRLLARPGLEALMISTHTPHHASVALPAIAAKKHFVMEKPLCDSVQSGKRMEAEAAKAGLVGMTGYQRVFMAANRDFIRLAQEIDPLQVTLTSQRGFFQPQYFFRENYGGIMDALTHDIDIGLRAAGGEPTSVFAQIRRGVFRPEKGAIEFVNILVDLRRDGQTAMANFSGSMGCPKPKNVFQAVGRGGFVVSAGHGEIVCVRHKGFRQNKEMIDPKEEIITPPNDAKDALKRLYLNFAKTIRGEEQNQSTLRHGLRALAVGEAAVQSAESGQRVEVSL